MTGPAPLTLPPLARQRGRWLLLLLLGLATLGALLIWGGGERLLARLANADGRLLALAVLIHYSGFALRGLRWQQLLRGLGHPLPYHHVTALLVSGWFVSALLPARAGDGVRVGALRLGARKQLPVPMADGLTSIVTERLLDMIAILLLGAAFGTALLRERLPTWIQAAYLLAGGLLLLFGLALLASPALFSRLRRLSARPHWQALLDFGQQLVAGVRLCFRTPRASAGLLAQSGAIWLCDGLLLWLVLLALQQPIPFSSAAFAALTVDLMAAVPLTPGGVGQIELAYSGLLALLTLPTASVPAAVLLTRAISYWSFLLVSGLVTAAAGFGALYTQISRDGS